MSSTAALIATIVATCITSISAYIAAHRKLSGRIESSEAGELWRESAAIRDDYRQRITAAEQRTHSLEERVEKLERANNNLQRVNSSLKTKNATLESTVSVLRDRILLSEEENARLAKRIIALQTSGKQEP